MKMNQKIAVTRSSMPDFEEYVAEIRPLWESRWLTNSGEKHRELESRLRAYLGVDNVSLCVNGHLALECILEAMELKGEVITTPFTFVSTTNALIRKGLTPVFCDIDPETYTIDPACIEPLITDRTTAILGVHVYGNLCDDERIAAIARRHGLKVIYDAAHAFGVEKDGAGALSMGDASMLSFHATKVFHCIEGGAAVFRESGYYDKLTHLKNFGMTSPTELTYAGGNAKMNEFCAAMGLCNLRHIDRAIAARKRAYEQCTARLSGVTGLKLNAVAPGVKSNYAYFPVVIDPAQFGCTRDKLAERLEEQGIGARKYFYPLTSTLACLRGSKQNATPVAERISAQVLCLPLYEDLDEKTADAICDAIISISER